MRVPLQQHDAESAALTELGIVLRLIDQGRIPVSEKMALPGAAAARTLNPVLSDGDFYPADGTCISQTPTTATWAMLGFSDWHILQKRYLSCLLFEYAATLGMLDVAYVAPWEVPCDYYELWGADDLPFMSRYDGLVYFRLTPLGAYCLGLTKEYRPRIREGRSRIEDKEQGTHPVSPVG